MKSYNFYRFKYFIIIYFILKFCTSFCEIYLFISIYYENFYMFKIVITEYVFWKKFNFFIFCFYWFQKYLKFLLIVFFLNLNFLIILFASFLICLPNIKVNLDYKTPLLLFFTFSVILLHSHSVQGTPAYPQTTLSLRGI